jgi:predicted flavoprotein YhiN
LRDQDVPLCVNCPVTGLQPVKNGFIVATAHFTVWAQNVLLATGGLSFPKTGSVGDGQDFARHLGHRIEPCRAGLTGLEIRDRAIAAQAGARFEDGEVHVLDATGQTVFSALGEVECEDWGLSGAAVYNCQRWMERYARNRAEANRPPEPLTLEVSLGDGETIRVERPRSRPLKEAIVTIGGVALSEVDPSTMESRIVPGLYFAGEVLDIDGPTGGYNLHAAFATARLAIVSMTRKPQATPRPTSKPPRPQSPRERYGDPRKTSRRW